MRMNRWPEEVSTVKWREVRDRCMHENDVSGASVPPNPSPTGNLAGRRSLASRGHKEASRLHDGDGRWPGQ